VVASVKDVPVGANLEILVQDGALKTRVEAVEPSNES
jgi:hypothetical protein